MGDFGNSVLRVVDNQLGSRMSGGNAESDALDAQTQATSEANATQKYIYDQQRADNAPWREAGIKALGGLESGDVFGGKGFEGDPGYQFRMSEGMKAINNAASARGMGNSGATMKALTRYGQDYSSNEYNNAYNREYNRMSSLAGFGTNANASNNAAAQNYGNSVAANQIGLGNANAAASIGQANRQGQMIAQGGQAAAMAFSDKRLKTSIVEITPEDLQEMRSTLKAYAFKYKSEDFGKGEWLGVMAQDLEKSKLGRWIVSEDEAGNKRIDIKKVMSVFLATMAEA